MTDAEPDIISSLPGHIIDHILSHLSIKEAVRTSVLSTKWRYKWATLPNLVFDSQCISETSEDLLDIKSKLSRIIDHVLLLHSGPIRKFKLSHRELIGVTDIDRWTLHLTRRPVKEFVLEIWKGQRYKIPTCLFSCQGLHHLELFNCWLKPPSTFQGFRNLKSLDLQHVTLAQDAFENLISSCPLLERLTLMNFDGFNHLNIRSPNLQFFDIGGKFDDISFENTSQLAVYLAMGVVPVKLPTPCIDLSYLSIRINFNDSKEISAALCLLRNSPNLRELEILARPEEQPVPIAHHTYCWEEVCLSWPVMRVQHVRIDGISGIKPELDFVNFLLQYSPVLEKMAVKPALNAGPELVKDLLRFRRASTRAEVTYLD
ncbi:F-box/FBD/LRR-repeat protein [Trifolium pratense]|uniref:F-box/FBD/LRR-repeat protein n=1 Tax=Trifolium pratense TaxID=57577 RepID=A0A2K3NGD2_TRIPR|nr:F-box/FBD/LRR-repeat protein [Trifolium pratense]